MDDEDDDLIEEITFEPCRDDRCPREDLHPTHTLPVELRGIKPQIEVCNACLGLVRLGATCTCGKLTFLHEEREEAPKILQGHVQGLCRWGSNGRLVTRMSEVTCRACLRALEKLVACPCGGGETCPFCHGTGLVRAQVLFQRGTLP